MTSDTSVPREPALATTYPLAPGGLTDVLRQRNIAVGLAPDGHVVLARPDSALVRVPRDREARGRLNDAAGRFDPVGARSLRSMKAGMVGEVRLGNEGALVGERQWGLDRVNSFISEAAGVWEAEYNYVVLAEQSWVGTPLGVVAAWIGNRAFPGYVHEDPATGQLSLLTTAQPAPAPAVWRAPLAIPGRRRPRVLVLDTGLRTVAQKAGTRAAATTGRRAEHTNLTGCGVPADWRLDPTPGVVDDEDEEFDEPQFATASRSQAASKLLDFEAGHGTFIAGIILQICPDAEVVSAGVLSSFGEGTTAGILGTLERMQRDHGPFDIVGMSFGAELLDDEAGLFGERLMELLGDSLGVAAAGNSSTCRPFYPAALPGVIGVGALQADGKAWFTNFGGWVDACAPGVDVVSTFFENFDEVLDGETTRQYRGWARWSGTSFSAPKVAAVIAQEQYLFGGTAKEAWKRITSHKHFRYPDLGIAFNV